MPDIMVDLETMGSNPNAPIVAIGAVAFDTNTYTIGHSFYTVVDLESEVKAGAEMDAGTVLWWMQQSEEARSVFKTVPTLAPLALNLFSDWIKSQGSPNDVRIWGNGASFDNVILTSAYRRHGVMVPWKFWNDRCYRTVKAQHPDIKLVRTGVHHNALNDAESQAHHLIDILKSTAGTL